MNLFPYHSGLGWDEGGEAWRAIGDGVTVYCGYWHGPTAREKGLRLAPQHQHATWSVDFEGYYETNGDDGIPYISHEGLHMERAFKTEKQAREWFDYVTWCLGTLTVEQVSAVCRELKGRMT